MSCQQGKINFYSNKTYFSLPEKLSFKIKYFACDNNCNEEELTAVKFDLVDFILAPTHEYLPQNKLVLFFISILIQPSVQLLKLILTNNCL